MKSISDRSNLPLSGLDRDPFLSYVIGSEIRKRKSGLWVDLGRIYSESEDLEMHNRVASCGFVPFVTPGSLLEAARDDPSIEVRETKEGGGWECRTKAKHKGSKNLSTAISAVLRYEVDGWMSLRSLQHVLTAHMGRRVPFGSIFISISGDSLRFQLELWQGAWWARANYRYFR